MAGQVGFDKAFSKQVTGTVQDVDASNAVRIGGIAMLNTTAAVAYLQMFKVPAASVTLGTTVPDYVIGLPASGGISLPISSSGWYTGGTALSVAGTTTRTGLTGAAIDVHIVHGHLVV